MNTSYTADELKNAMKESAKMVQEFHAVFGHPVGEKPVIGLSERRGAERGSYLISELLEGLEAALAEDAVEVVDAMGDAIYFACGDLVECGVANEAYLGRALDEATGDLDIDAEIADVERDVAASGNWARFMRCMFIRCLKESSDVHESDLNYEAKEEDVQIHVLGLSTSMPMSLMFVMKTVMGADPLAVMTEIHRSNMSKLLPDHLESEEQCRAFMDFNKCGVAPALLIFERLEDGRWIAKHAGTGKIIKNPLYSKVDLKPLVPLAP